AVHDLVVDAGADDAGERRVAAVAEERADGAGVADHARGDLVKLAGRDARAQLGLQHVQDAGQDLSGGTHPGDLGRTLEGDHAGAMCGRHWLPTSRTLLRIASV